MSDIEYIEHLEALVGLWAAIAHLHGDNVPEDMRKWCEAQCNHPSTKAASALRLTYAVMANQAARASRKP